jgi:hypothetical protein
LIGLSESAVASVVVTALLGLTCAAAGAIAGLENDPASDGQADKAETPAARRGRHRKQIPRLNAAPIAAVAVAVAFSASVGIRAREARWLLPDTTIAEGVANPSSARNNGGGLNSGVPTEGCSELRNQNDPVKLKSLMLGTGNASQWAKLAGAVPSQNLASLVAAICG